MGRPSFGGHRSGRPGALSLIGFFLAAGLMAIPGAFAVAIAEPAAPRSFTASPATSGAQALAGAENSLNAPNGPPALARPAVTGNWSPISVPTRNDAETVYDTADGYVLGFGIVAEDAKNATWRLNATHWEKVPTVRAPSARIGAALAYDPVAGEVLLFGGIHGSTFLNDSWAYRGGVWSPVSSASGPSPRAFASLGFAAHDRTMILFGGRFGPCGGGHCRRVAYNDTWSFGPGGWTLLAPSAGVAPSPRWGAGAMNNSSSGPLVLFGGQEFTNYTIYYPPNASFPHGRNVTYWSTPALNDTWTFSAGAWSLALTPRAPPASAPVRFTASPRAGNLTLFDVAPGCIQTWSWNGSRWRLLNSSPPPPCVAYRGSPTGVPPSNEPVIYDPTLRGVVWLGDPLWILHGRNWSVVRPASYAPSNPAPKMVWDAGDGYVLLFRGSTGQTWTYSKGIWTQLSLTVHPPGEGGYAITYDAADGYVVLFGGAQYGSPSSSYGAGNTTWTFSHGIWTPLLNTTAHAPLPRWAPQMAYDARDGYVVLVGGNTGAPGYWCVCMTWFNANWTFKAGLWTHVTATGSLPPPRVSAAMAYDPALGAVVVYGGTEPGGPTGFAPLGDTWEFQGGTWTNITPAGGAGPREAPVLVFDVRANLLVLFGSSSSRAVWALEHGAWRVLRGIAPMPADHTGPGFVFDPHREAIMLMGGGPDWKVQDAWWLRLT